ncbi:Hypothetical protein POVR2_LOCUS18 [uncultured virus]|nr:Hypothetical protein POVR2_LOCUS18 [uncultured virus]
MNFIDHNNSLIKLLDCTNNLPSKLKRQEDFISSLESRLQLVLSANLTSKKLANNEFRVGCNFSQNSDVIERLENFSEVYFFVYRITLC